MIKKSYLQSSDSCRVTFQYTPKEGQEVHSAYLVGEFNDWDQTKHEMKQRKAGYFSTTVTLQPGQEYRFKYLLNGHHWTNDDEADKHIPNDQGTTDSVVVV